MELQPGPGTKPKDRAKPKSSTRDCSVSRGTHSAETELTRRFPLRNRKRPKYLAEYDLNSSADEQFHDSCELYDEINHVDYLCKISNIPTFYAEAVNSENSSEWQSAMQREYDSLVEMDTFDVVPRPTKKTVRIIGGRWVYAIKSDEKQRRIFKARYVAKGFSQVASLNYDETFSPTARLTSIRVLCQLAAEYDLKIYQVDVKSAYLNAPIDYDIFLEQPEGFERFDSEGNKMVLKLKKGLYGLKQAGTQVTMIYRGNIRAILD